MGMNFKAKRYLDRKVDYAVALHAEGYSWEYIREDLEMELSYERPMDGSTIEVYADYVIRQARYIVEFQI